MIVREIVERPSGSANPPLPPQPPRLPSSGGFPVARRRDPRLKPSNIASGPSSTSATTTSERQQTGLQSVETPGQPLSDAEELRRAIDQENVARIQAMSFEEREQEAEELRDRFGQGVIDLMRRRREARQSRNTGEGIAGPSGTAEFPSIRDKGEQPQKSEAISTSRIRKNDLPSSAHTQHLAIPPPPPLTPDDTSPEALKERYFPNHAAEPSKLAWLQPSSSVGTGTDTSIRFDLSGRVLSAEAKERIPTTAGLHHHGTSPDLAGYTLEDVLWLSRSTVPSQKITMLGVLARIVQSYIDGKMDIPTREAFEKEAARHKALELGLDVLITPTKSLGILRAGIDVLYEALGGRTWTWIDDCTRYRPDEDEQTGIAAVPFTDILPTLQDLLSKGSGLPPASTYQLISIIRRAVFHSQDLAETVAPIVPLLISDRVLKSPWPMDDDDPPSIEALRLLRNIVDSSRAIASVVVDADIVQPLLKFLVVSAWPDSDEAATLPIVVEALRIYTSLGRYGLSVSLAINATDIIRSLGQWVEAQCTSPSRSYAIRAVVRAYFDLLAIWTTCAIDPHKTTPEHALTWSQVTALGWIDEGLDVLTRLAKQAGRWDELGSVLRLTVAWITGLEINGASGGLDGKREIYEKARSAELGAHIGLGFDSADLDEEAFGGVLLQAVRLDLLLKSEGDPDPSELILSQRVRQRLVDYYLTTGAATTTEGASLRAEVLRLALRDGLVGPEEWAVAALSAMEEFQSGEEPFALDLIDDILKSDWSTPHPELRDSVQAIGHSDKLQILRPLLHYAILPSGSSVIGPSTPSPTYLKATTTLRQPPIPSPNGKREAGLPLLRDWLFTPINELLQSSTSPALAQAPPDWDASELDLVRATLVLVRADLASQSFDRSLLLLNLMKVFMLEHDQSASTSESEAFRDSSIVLSLQELIKPLLVPSSASTKPATSLPIASTMEQAAIPFLGPDIPFYQFYSDFLALYEAVSYSDPIFSQLVLPPLAMTYPVDFRKLLWVEQPTALRSIRTQTKNVPLELDLVAFFTPRETDSDVLAGYTRALVRGWVVRERTEFLWQVATFHLAHLFWVEGEDGEKEKDKVVRLNLMRAIIGTASPEVIQEVVSLDLQAPGHGERVTRAQIDERQQIIADILGQQARAKVEKLM